MQEGNEIQIKIRSKSKRETQKYEKLKLGPAVVAALPARRAVTPEGQGRAVLRRGPPFGERGFSPTPNLSAAAQHRPAKVWEGASDKNQPSLRDLRNTEFWSRR